MLKKNKIKIKLNGRGISVDKGINLAILIDKSTKYLTTNQFLEAINGNLKKKLN